MNKHVYYSLAAVMGLGALGIGTVAAENFDNGFNRGEARHESREHRSEHIEELANAFSLDLDSIKSQIEEGTKMKDILEANGLDKETVHAKMQGVHKEKLAAAVASGEITQEQADKKLEHMEKRKEDGFKGKKQMKRPSPEKMAEVLGLDVDEVKSELEAGKKMKDILEANGLDREAVHEKMKAAHKVKIQELVGEGKITQEQADEKLERMENHEFGDRKERRQERREGNERPDRGGFGR